MGLKKKFVSLSLFLVSFLYPQAQGLEISNDKWTHLFASAYITEQLQNQHSDLDSASICLSLGLLKECYDWINTKRFDTTDLLFDIFGISLALLTN